MKQHLYNPEEIALYENIIGKAITKVENDVESVSLWFNDIGIKLRDNGQSCCEHRFMSTDDNPQSMVGQELREIEIADGPNLNDESYSLLKGKDTASDEPHDTQFLKIKTDQQTITFVNHNEHNGYYGGFSIQVTALGVKQ